MSENSPRFHRHIASLAHALRQWSLPTWLRWPIGFGLPFLLIAFLASSLFWTEYRTHRISRGVGRYLLRQNDGRQARGSVWQGILASRQTRSQLQTTDTLSILTPENLDSLPQAILRCRYSVGQRSENALVLRAERRPLPLRPEKLTRRQMQELARSLHVYEQGKQLLAHATPPRDLFQVLARIRAQIALEEGSIFPLLHRRLRARDLPAAWEFVRMTDEDRRYWRELLDRFLTDVPSTFVETDPEAIPTAPELAPEVADAVRGLVRDWEDSLMTAEVVHLRAAWDRGDRFRFRIVRNMDTFTGHALTTGEIPVTFDIPADQAERLLDLSSRPEVDR